MTLYSYIVARDYGFAPNPFNGICTLATCKPGIRGHAIAGDWVIGTGAKTRHKISGRLLFAMQVTEKLSFSEYWNDDRFQLKKPHMNGALKQAFGDNIYFFKGATGDWHQENSHHSYANGQINYNNLIRDTKYPYVLISDHFYYFGVNHVAIPNRLAAVCASTQGYKSKHDPHLVNQFIAWLKQHHTPGFKGNPLQFKNFERYHGVK